MKKKKRNEELEFQLRALILQLKKLQPVIARYHPTPPGAASGAWAQLVGVVEPHFGPRRAETRGPMGLRLEPGHSSTGGEQRPESELNLDVPFWHHLLYRCDAFSREDSYDTGRGEACF